jgi:hypothetical protein
MKIDAIKFGVNFPLMTVARSGGAGVHTFETIRAPMKVSVHHNARTKPRKLLQIEASALGMAMSASALAFV